VSQVSWSSKKDAKIEKHVRSILDAMNADGSRTGPKITHVDESSRVLADHIAIGGVDAAYDRSDIIVKALVTTKKGSTSPPADLLQHFRTELEGVVAARGAEKRRLFNVVFPLNLLHGNARSFASIRVLGVEIRRVSWDQIQLYYPADRWWKHVSLVDRHEDYVDRLTSKFVPLVASLEARDQSEAWLQASEAFELFRTVLNLQGTWGRKTWQLGMPRPLGTILPAQIYGVFDEAKDKEYWYFNSTTYDYDSTPRSRRPNWRSARRVLNVVAGVRAEDLRQLLVDALVKYGEALDTIEWRQAFLSLWLVLELLSLQERGGKWDVVDRIAGLLGNQERDRDLLSVLADTRNTLVHAGRYPNSEGFEEVQFLKRFAERSINNLLSRSKGLKNRTSLRLLYEHLNDPVLEERVRIISMLARERRKKSSGKGPPKP
jgi:hypothetical protein